MLSAAWCLMSDGTGNRQVYFEIEQSAAAETRLILHSATLTHK